MIRLPTLAPNVRERKQVAFDDEEITEHDKDRGTRMKIQEPDTPFMRSPILSDDESEDSRSPSVLEKEGSMRGRRDPAAHEAFLAKRKEFYREFEAVKQPRSRATSSSDESEVNVPTSLDRKLV